MAMVSISRSLLLAASLLAFPLAGAMAQHDPSKEGEGKSTNSSSASGNNQAGSPQSTPQSTKDVNGKPSENAATAGQSGK
jgi:hypothetical protein